MFMGGLPLTYWHVETDYVALVLFAVMLAKNRRRGKDAGLQQKLFFWVLICSIISVTVDIASSLAMESAQGWWLYQVMMVLYVIDMPLMAAGWLGYLIVLTADGTAADEVLLRKVHLSLLPYVVYCAMALTNPLTGLFFSLSPDMVYARGPLFLPAGFGIIIAYSLASIVTAIRGRRHFINRSDAYFMSLFIMLTLAAITLQLLNPGWLISCSSYALLYYFCDMTIEEEHRKMLYDEIERQNIELKRTAARETAANKAKSDFLASMSHDIRTPMNAIVGMTNMAIENIDDRKHALEDLHIVQASSKHLLELINDVLDLSKIESGKMTITAEPFLFADLLSDLETMSLPIFHAKQQRLKVDAAAMDHEFLVGDMTHLKQVLTNLLSNANKYTPYGGHIALTIAEQLRTGEHVTEVCFTVADDGIGISPAKQQEIFEPFTREINTTVNPVEGTGLGLTIVKNIVTAMDGTISLVSSKGQGSTFTVTVPLGYRDEKQGLAEFADVLDDRMLLVVDTPEKCEAKRRPFLAAGINCDAISRDRLAAAAPTIERDYAVVIIINEDNPIDSIQQVRRIAPDIDIVFVCDMNMMETAEAAIKAGADSLLYTPSFKTTLFEELQRIKRRKASRLGERGYLAHRRILVAEDQPINFMIVKHMLTAAGAEVAQAADGQAALDMFKASDVGGFDLVLMDIMMPGMNGYEATAAIRGLDRPDAKKVPIVAMTANAFSEDIAKSRTAGMDAHISKPLDADTVRKVLSGLLAAA